MHKAIKRNGFTLIELLIVIVIIGLIGIGVGASYTQSLKSGRDNRRKADLNNIQKALELYYEDVQRYPASITLGNPLCHPNGCVTHTYMQTVPRDPRSSFRYVYRTDLNGTFFQLYSCLENTNDTGNGVNQSGYTADCGCGPQPACKYGVASTNIVP